MRYDALLFDLDGTLVNSIDLYGEAVMEAMGKFGMPITHERYRQWYVAGTHIRHWLAEFGKREEDEPGVRQERDRRYVELLRSKIAWCAGAKDLLEYFHGKIPMGLVTGSWMRYVDAIDERLQVKRYFETIVTVDDIGKFTKPHPHSLLLAADRLKVDPKKCLYVGDQLFDVEAAKAAGMPCCVVRGTYTTEAAMKAAEFVAENMQTLPKKAKISEIVNIQKMM